MEVSRGLTSLRHIVQLLFSLAWCSSLLCENAFGGTFVSRTTTTGCTRAKRLATLPVLLVPGYHQVVNVPNRYLVGGVVWMVMPTTTSINYLYIRSAYPGLTWYWYQCLWCYMPVQITNYANDSRTRYRYRYQVVLHNRIRVLQLNTVLT